MTDNEVVWDPGGSIFCWIVSVITTMSRRHQKSDWSNLKMLMLLISQIDIVMCFIYNISAMSWRYRRHHPNFVTISECPLGGFLKSATLFISTNTDIYTKLLKSSESLLKVKFRLTKTFLVIFLTSVVISKHLLFHENTVL